MGSLHEVLANKVDDLMGYYIDDTRRRSNRRRAGRRLVCSVFVEKDRARAKENHLSRHYESRSFYSAVLLVSMGRQLHKYVPVDGFVE